MGERLNLRLVEGEAEQPKTDRMMTLVRSPDWDFLGSLASLPDNKFYKTPVVREIPPQPPPGGDYDQPESDALAA